MKKSRPLTSIIFPQIIGFIIFIILLSIANFLVPLIPNDIYRDIISFINSNVILSFFLLFVGLINEIFWNFNFPFNLLAPVTSTIFSVFIITLFYRMWIFLDGYVHAGISIPIYTIYTVIALIVFIAGYMIIIASGGKTKEKVETDYQKEFKKIKRLSTKKKSDVEWDDVKGQSKLLVYNLEETIKVVLYNIIEALNKIMEKDKKSKKKRR